MKSKNGAEQMFVELGIALTGVSEATPTVVLGVYIVAEGRGETAATDAIEYFFLFPEANIIRTVALDYHLYIHPERQ